MQWNTLPCENASTTVINCPKFDLPTTKYSQWTDHRELQHGKFHPFPKIIRWNPFVCSDRLEKWQFL